MTGKTMRYVTLGFTALAFIAYLLAFFSLTPDAVVFFFPFTMIPYVITAVLACRWRTFIGQTFLLAAALAYAAWFAFIYLDVVYWHPDANSALALLFVSIWAAPVLLILWIAGFVLELWQRKKTTEAR